MEAALKEIISNLYNFEIFINQNLSLIEVVFQLLINNEHIHSQTLTRNATTDR